MTHRKMRPATIAVVLVASAWLTGCGSSSKTTSSSPSPQTTAGVATTARSVTARPNTGTVSVMLTEYKIKASVSSAPAGQVIFDVTNVGKIKHQFTVIRTTRSAATVLSKHNPNDDIPGSKGEIASVAPGATRRLVIRNMKAGHYAFVCALPGHYQLGMSADFTVR